MSAASFKHRRAIETRDSATVFRYLSSGIAAHSSLYKGRQSAGALGYRGKYVCTFSTQKPNRNSQPCTEDSSSHTKQISQNTLTLSSCRGRLLGAAAPIATFIHTGTDLLLLAFGVACCMFHVLLFCNVHGGILLLSFPFASFLLGLRLARLLHYHIRSRCRCRWVTMARSSAAARLSTTIPLAALCLHRSVFVAWKELLSYTRALHSVRKDPTH